MRKKKKRGKRLIASTQSLISGMWTPFSFEGPRPPPCADFSLTSVDLYRAILYGGRRGADENSNDLYVIDFSEKVLTFSYA